MSDILTRWRELRYQGKYDSPLLVDIRKNFTVASSRPVLTFELLPLLRKSRTELVEGMRADTIRLGQQLRHQRPGRSEPERSAVIQGSDRRWRYP
jgi:hypothetical protein